MTQATRRKYKTTYYMRREEIDALRQEEDELMAQIQRLLDESGDLSYLRPRVQQNDLLRLHIQARVWALYDARALLSNCLANQALNPLETFIHLSDNPAHRKRTLLSLRDQKLCDANDFLMRRTQGLDLRRSYRQVEFSEADDGDVFVEQLVVVPFPEVTSVQELYEALLLALSHQQFAASEQLGNNSMCELEEPVDDTASQWLFNAMMLPGIDLEKNSVVFRDYNEQTDRGLVVTDFVNEDELYPYHPESRVRLDVTSVTMISRVGDTSTTLVRWARSRLSPPTSGLSTQTMTTLRDFIPPWADITHQTMREYIAQGPRMATL
ncbi:hypothetical protein Poli38472_012203 [Pythium oligandrum]|uniref:Uncharacterized protein n=1 Tax=Pythium oligandrum TaxID=41045 RepID=A0A8K1CP08_PYTOL|nr:hypothetical protein Poli38472_012203 [Pythium oligandrum]|eukprot:TMW67087.1 hypothetical protein Poli38472_012203 [Pythium oligandrum]